MDVNLTTPAVFFPARSLLMLAFTNRFLALASLIRSLHNSYRTQPEETLLLQIKHLRHRIALIRNMQAFGIVSIFLCVVAMGFLFVGWRVAGRLAFGLSILSLLTSLALSFREVQLSGGALDYLLADLERRETQSAPTPPGD